MPNYLQTKIDRVQSVVKFFEDPCQAPWSVYFELALPALGEVVIELLSFGLDDVIRGYFRPKGLYRRGRTGILARRFGKYARIPELGEMIGAHIPGADTIKGRKISSGLRHLWLIDGALQRLLFWWMIVDLLTDFLYNWTSAINKTEFCQGRCSGAVTCPVLPNTVPAGVWVTIGADLANCEKSWGNASIAGGAPVYASVSGWTACAVSAIPLIGACTGVEVRITNGVDRIYDTNVSTENPDGTFSGITAGKIPPGEFTFVQAKAVGCLSPNNSMLITGGTMSGWAD